MFGPRDKYGRPSLLYTFTELARTTGEFLALQAALTVLRRAAPGGKGLPVLVLPGFAFDDLTTQSLRSFLKDKGHEPYGWDNGIHWTFNRKNAQHLAKRLDDIYSRHGQKVALIGHSLGGLVARELARAFPEKVSQVITLGSPFGGGAHKKSSFYFLREAIEYLSDMTDVLQGDELAAQMLTPPPVPTTSLYTIRDGIVNWRTCLNPETPKSENIAIAASHCGLIVNPLSFLVIADRLAQKAGKWKPFDRAKYPLPFVINEECGAEHAPGLPPLTGGANPLFKPE